MSENMDIEIHNQDVMIEDDIETIDLENETDELSYIWNRYDCRWYPGCENHFILLNRECPEKNFYEDINRDNYSSYKGVRVYDHEGNIYTDNADAVMSMNGFYLGKPCYLINVFDHGIFCKNYKIQVGTFGERSIHKHDSWTWQLWEYDSHGMYPDRRIGQRQRCYKHYQMGYIPSEYDQWDIPESEKWIEDIIKTYLQEFRTRMSMHELTNEFDQL